MLSEYREDLLAIGAPGRLMMVSDLEILPVEDAELFKRANPLTEDGRIKLDPATVEAREDAIVKNLLHDGSFAFIVLGGGHDLSDNIERLSGGTCEYLTVETLKYQELSNQ